MEQQWIPIGLLISSLASALPRDVITGAVVRWGLGNCCLGKLGLHKEMDWTCNDIGGSYLFFNDYLNWFNILRLRQNGWHFTYNFFNNFLSPELPTNPINKKPALVQIMDRCETGDKPLSEAMMAKFTHWLTDITCKLFAFFGSVSLKLIVQIPVLAFM